MRKRKTKTKTKTTTNFTKNNNKTRKTSTRKTNSIQKNEQYIVVTFLRMLNTVKLYHWKTSSFAKHKATDELYASLNTNIDRFVEEMLGKKGNRLDFSKVKSIPINELSSDKQAIKEFQKFKNFLVTIDDKLPNMSNTDLLNIRDEILGSINQFLYLATFT